MANKKNIKELNTTSTVNAQDFLHVSQGGIDKKIPAERFLEQMSGGNPFNLTVIEESSTSRILTIHDVRAYIICTNDNPVTIHLLGEAFVPWRLGHNIIIRKEGEGNVTISPLSGATISNSPYGLTLTETGQIGQLIYVGNNTWHFITGIDTGAGGGINQAQLDAEVAARIAADEAEQDARVSADQNIQSQLTGNVPLEASAFSPISWHDQSVDNSVEIPPNKNAWSFGPSMTISAGQTVTVGIGSSWTIANGDVQE